MTLSEFILARIAEDEALARNSLGAAWLRWALAECDAKRNLVALADYWRDDANDYGQLDQALRLMAVVWADHADYNGQEWKP